MSSCDLAPERATYTLSFGLEEDGVHALSLASGLHLITEASAIHAYASAVTNGGEPTERPRPPQRRVLPLGLAFVFPSSAHSSSLQTAIGKVAAVQALSPPRSSSLAHRTL